VKRFPLARPPSPYAPGRDSFPPSFPRRLPNLGFPSNTSHFIPCCFSSSTPPRWSALCSPPPPTASRLPLPDPREVKDVTFPVSAGCFFFFFFLYLVAAGREPLMVQFLTAVPAVFCCRRFSLALVLLPPHWSCPFDSCRGAVESPGSDNFFPPMSFTSSAITALRTRATLVMFSHDFCQCTGAVPEPPPKRFFS